MSLKVNSLNNAIYFGSDQSSSKSQYKRQDDNPISLNGERANLAKATFLGGLALGARLLFEVWADTGGQPAFIGEMIGKQADKLVKNTKNATPTKKLFMYALAAASCIALAVGGFALLYTIFNAPKINYNAKVDTFKKGREMDNFIQRSEVEKELYTQMAEKGKEDISSEERQDLQMQFVKMNSAKNQTPNLIAQIDNKQAG